MTRIVLIHMDLRLCLYFGLGPISNQPFEKQTVSILLNAVFGVFGLKINQFNKQSRSAIR